MLATQRHQPENQARFIDPRVLARIATLELLARTVVEGFVSGLHRSPRFGLSTDFAEHRHYQPGDDLRRLDWKLYGRTDRFYLKEFEAETNAGVIVLLDGSRSMSYGSTGITKLDYARYLAASLLWFSQSQRDKVGLITFDRDLLEHIPASTRRLPHCLHALERMAKHQGESAGPGSLESPLKKATELLTRRGIAILISDLYEPAEQVLHACGHLKRRGNDVIVLQVLDPAELSFPFGEASSFEDLETGERIPVVPDRVQADYRRRMERHLQELRRLLGRGGMDFATFDTSKPLDHALFNYLSNRQRLSRAR
jgi:uncharacterized protein (DUF58 family)